MNQAYWRKERPKGSKTKKIIHVVDENQRVVAAVFDADTAHGAKNANIIASAERMWQIIQVVADKKVRGFDRQTGAQVVTMPEPVINEIMNVLRDIEGEE